MTEWLKMAMDSREGNFRETLKDVEFSPLQRH